MFEKITSEMNSLYSRKNKDYNDSFGKSFEEYGMSMPCIRLEDKLNRLKSIVKSKDIKVASESLEDTLIDMACYSVMTLIEVRNEKR